MALTYQELSAYTNNHIVPKSSDLVYKNDPLLARLMARRLMQFEGGLQVNRPLMYAELNGDFFERGETFNIAFVPTDTALSVLMKYAEVNITLYGTDKVLNRGADAAFSQVALKMRNAAMKMSKILSTNLYKDGLSSSVDVLASGGLLSTTKAFTGLLAWIDDGNSGSGYQTATDLTRSFPTVGAVLRSDLATVPNSGTQTPTASIGGLNSYVNRNFNTFQLTEIQNAYGKSAFGADQVDLMVTQQVGMDRFWAATQPLQRYQDQNSDIAKIGFYTFRFNSSEVVVSKYMPEGLMFGLNTKYIDLIMSIDPMFYFGFTGFKEAQGSIDVSGQYLVSLAMMLSNPRTCFKLVGSALSS